MTTVREQLFGATAELPEFRLLLPAGWESLPLTDDTLAGLERRVHEFFVRAGRPDLDGTFTPRMVHGVQRAAAAGGKYVILPTSPPGGQPLPLSMLVTVISGEGGGTLDAWVAARFRAGATMLDDSGRVVTWRSERRGTGEEAGVKQVQLHYLEPVPETHRRKGLMLSGTVLLQEDGEDEPPLLVAAKAVFDAVASTLTWMPAGSASAAAPTLEDAL